MKLEELISPPIIQSLVKCTEYKEGDNRSPIVIVRRTYAQGEPRRYGGVLGIVLYDDVLVLNAFGKVSVDNFFRNSTK